MIVAFNFIEGYFVQKIEHDLDKRFNFLIIIFLIDRVSIFISS